MRAPGFWFTSQGCPDWRARVLAPLGALYAAATARRLARGRPWQPPVPVICVGNLSAGGTGKTPTVIALAERLAARGARVAVVSRGYGGSLPGPVRVDPAVHDAGMVGDEPLLLSAFAATYVARSRRAGVEAAAADGAGVVLFDDGFQNPEVAKALSIVVADAAQGFGNGRCLPAGPLREPVSVGLKRADFVLTIGPEPAQTLFDREWGDAVPCPRLKGALQPLPTGMDWQGLRAVAFAGIGQPQKFFATLAGLGADVVRSHAFDDHQPFSTAVLHRLETEAAAQGAQLVTTEKDAARLPAAFRGRVLVLPVRLELDDWSALDAAFAHLSL